METPKTLQTLQTLENAALLAAAQAASGSEAGQAGTQAGTEIRTEPTGTEPAGTEGGAEGRAEPAGREAAPDNPYGEFAWPDGYAADPETLARFVAVAGRLGLAKPAAQELAGLYAELDLERGRRQADFLAKNNDDWLKEIAAHPEFGGARLGKAAEDVAAVMRRFGSSLLTAQIRQMNVQNWPEMFYFLARVAGALAEDSSPASAGGAEPAAGKSAAQILFPGLK